MSTSRSGQDHSIGQLVSGVTTNVSSLVRLELELAKSEIQAQVKQGAAGGGLVAAALFLLFLVAILVSFAAVYGLTYVMPVWAAFLTVAGVYLLLAVILGLVARSRFQKLKGPERTIAQVEATKSAFAERTDLRAQAKASGMSVDELKVRRLQDQATTADS